MKHLRQRIARFILRNRDKGIPNLMLWIMGISAFVYFLDLADPSSLFVNLLCFDRYAILHGQVWRLVTFVFTSLCGQNLFWAVIAFLFYYQAGAALEKTWGRLRFNLYYLTGVIASVVGGLVLGSASASYLNLSLFLGFATLFPDSIFRLFFFIPIRARWLGLIDLLLQLLQLLQFSRFPYNLLPLFVLANYLLYFGKDVLNLLPMSWSVNLSRLFRKRPKTAPKSKASTVDAYLAYTAAPKGPYMHRCTVCGRTDADNPDLEFRYCSRCKGYQCYCIDHINNHEHITE